MGAFNQLNGAIFDAAAIEARISAIDGKSIYNQRDGGILDFDSLARRLTALDGKVAVGQGGIEFDVDSFMRRLAAIEAGTFTPLSLFAAGEQGGWWDTTDFSTMFQDSAGTTPLTAVGQPVGLLLDKRLGLATTPVTVSSWANNGYTTFNTVGASVTFAAASSSFTTATVSPFLPTTFAGQVFQVVVDVTLVSGSFTFYIGTSGASLSANVSVTSSGRKTFLLVATAASSSVSLAVQSGNPVSATVNVVSMGALPGNHLSQSTTTSRPLEQFNTALVNRFDGVDDLVGTANFPASTMTSMDGFIVINRNSAWVSVFGDALTKSWGSGIAAGGGSALTNVGASATLLVNGAPLTGGNAVTDGTVAAAVPTSAWAVLEAHNLDLSAWTQIRLGFFNGSYPGAEDIAGLVICPVKSDPIRQQVRTYLGAKVGLSL